MTLLALVVLHTDRTYEAIDRMNDLQANRATTSGKYNYEPSKQQIDWIRASGVFGLDFTCLTGKVRISLSFTPRETFKASSMARCGVLVHPLHNDNRAAMLWSHLLKAGLS